MMDWMSVGGRVAGFDDLLRLDDDESRVAIWSLHRQYGVGLTASADRVFAQFTLPRLR